MNKLYSIFLLLIMLNGCISPEKSYQRALKNRSLNNFQKIIDKFPDSEFVDSAKFKIGDISYWLKIDSSILKKDFEAYLDSFSDGLFRFEAEIKVKDILSFEIASNSDMISDYENYLGEFPNSIFQDSAKARIIALESADQKYQQIKKSNDTNEMKSYINEFGNTGYGRIVQSRLDSLVITQVEGAILNKETYQKLPKTYFAIKDFINNQTDTSLILLAKKAREEILIETIKTAGVDYRFTISDLKINQLTKSSRFCIEQVSVDSSEFLTLYTLYPGDSFNLEVESFFGNMIFIVTGSALHPGNLNPDIHFSDGNVLRFSGKVNVDEYIITGDKDDLLSFYLIKDIGAVYLNGKGTVEHNGIITYLSKN